MTVVVGRECARISLVADLIESHAFAARTANGEDLWMTSLKNTTMSSIVLSKTIMSLVTIFKRRNLSPSDPNIELLSSNTIIELYYRSDNHSCVLQSLPG